MILEIFGDVPILPMVCVRGIGAKPEGLKWDVMYRNGCQ